MSQHDLNTFFQAFILTEIIYTCVFIVYFVISVLNNSIKDALKGFALIQLILIAAHVFMYIMFPVFNYVSNLKIC